VFPIVVILRCRWNARTFLKKSETPTMLTINPEYLRSRAARLRMAAKNLGSDPDAEKVWQMAEDMETLALEIDQRPASPPSPRRSAPVHVVG
jgi:hypothetical protein